jgi:hypothetical protein
LAYRDLLIAAAEAGDFSEHSSDDGVRVSIAIQGAEQSSPNNDDGSPLAQMLAGREFATRIVDNDALAYELVFPAVERLLTNVNAYEPLWRDGWKAVAEAIESFESGRSQARWFLDSGISLITLAPEIFSGGAFSPTKHSAPFTAISKYARGELFLIAIPTAGGWFYRLDYPYYSWAETVVRPRIARRDLSSALLVLNQKESSRDGTWKTDRSEMTSAVKFLDENGSLTPSKLHPEDVLSALTDGKYEALDLHRLTHA